MDGQSVLVAGALYKEHHESGGPPSFTGLGAIATPPVSDLGVPQFDPSASSRPCGPLPAPHHAERGLWYFVYNSTSRAVNLNSNLMSGEPLAYQF